MGRPLPGQQWTHPSACCFSWSRTPGLSGRATSSTVTAGQASGMARPKASRVTSVGLGPAADAGLERVDRGDSSSVSSKSKTSMFSAMRCRLGRLRDHRAALLEVPAQHHLRRRLAVRLGDPGDGRVFERAGVLAVAVEGDAADRRPGLGEDAVLGVERLDLGLLEVRVDLDLVDRRARRRGVEQLRSRWSTMKLLTPIARTLPSAEQRLQGPVGVEGLVESVGSAWCRISRSIWSTPSLPALLSKPCRVSS